jgi:hypothetical protein
MDMDKNGYLVSEELDRYRAPYRQEAQGMDTKENTGANRQGEKKGNRHGSKKAESIGKPLDQATLIDPVMSADTNLDFKVTLEEFLAQAETRFTTLDADHNGRLNRDEVLVLCKKKD